MNPRWLLVLVVVAQLIPASVHAALTLDATMHHDPVRPGEMLQLDLTVTNSDVFTRLDIVLTMAYPEGLFQLSETEFDGDCPSTTCSTGETVTWNLGSIPPGGHLNVDLPAIVDTAAVSGTVITFSPMVTDVSAVTDSASVSVKVDDATRFDLAMSESSDPVMPGDALNYRITWGYRADSVGDADADIEFTLPTGTSFVSASDDGSLDGSTVTWPLGILQPGQGGIHEVTVLVDDGISTPAVITGSAQLINTGSPGEMATTNTSTVAASAVPLSLAIETGINPARQEGPVHFTAIVTNNNPFTRFGLTLTAQHPQDTQPLLESEFAGNCAGTSCTPGERITWTLGDLPAGSSVRVDLPLTSLTTLPDGVLINLFMTVSDNMNAHARQSDTIRIQDDRLFDLSLHESDDPGLAGIELAYRAQFANSGTVSTENSRLLFKLPEGVSFVSATDSGSHNNGVVTWPLGNLSPGQGGSRDVIVLPDGGLPISSVLEAWAETQSLTTPVERVRFEAATSLSPSLSLAAAFASNPQPVRAGELTQVQMTVTNHSPFTRFGIELTSRMPPNTNRLFESEFEGDCAGTSCASGDTVTWTIGSIPAGGFRSVDFPLLVSSESIDGLLIDLTATARDDQGFAALAGDTLRVQSSSPYNVSLSEESDPAVAGETLHYRVVYGYLADAPQPSDTQLRLKLPDGVAFVSASDGGILVSDEVQWSLGILNPGQGDRRSVEVLIDESLAPATVLKAEAIVESTTSPIEQARSGITTVIAPGGLSLSITSAPNPADASDQLQLQLSVRNNDAFTRFGVALVSRLPQNLNPLFETEFEGDCGSTSCTTGERIIWPQFNIAAGQMVTVDLPPTVSPSVLNGSLIDFYASVRDEQGVEAHAVHSVRIGDPSPADDLIFKNGFETGD